MSIYTVMTFNLMNRLTSASFHRRASGILELIRTYDPDILGIQEFCDYMLEDLDSLTDTYTMIGAARGARPSFANERNCVLVRKGMFKVLDSHTYWLSKTPDIPGSRLTGSMFPRIVTMVTLQDKHHMFTVANTHLDHMFEYVRVSQAEILGDLLNEANDGEMTILTGDFNTILSQRTLRTLTEKTGLRDVSPYNPTATIRSIIRLAGNRYSPIDHILVSKKAHVMQAKIITSMFMGSYPSDHFPVVAEIELPESYLSDESNSRA
ncbi:MAG: endonuclease/exonuclease/phosphatase family protein [Solobacterium sp.]|nr:endonuclease/exonuclease/phosphatase family protein [Solobacterium sp.]